MVKYIKVIDAHQMRCPTLNQPCAGKQCMAFKYKVDTRRKQDVSGSSFPRPPEAYTDYITNTEYGYCGMVN